MQDHQMEDPIEEGPELREIFEILWRWKWLVVCITAVFFFVSMYWCISGGETITRTRIRMTFPGIEKHEYPDGVQFEMNDVIAPDVLSGAAASIEDSGRRNLFLSAYRKFIRIEPTAPSQVRQQMDADGKIVSEYIVFPDQFYVDLVQPGDAVFSDEEANGIIHGLISCYEDKFRRNYVERPLLVLDLSEDILASHDYVDVVDILKLRAETYSSFLEQIIEDAGFYRSSNTGQSFVDLKNSIDTMRKLDLEDIDSIISIIQMTRKKDDLHLKYEYKIRNLERKIQKKQKESEIARTLLQEVWAQDKDNRGGERASFLLTDSSLLHQIGEKEYISFLIKRALEAGVEASSLNVEKSFIEVELAALSSGSGEGKYVKFSYDNIDERINNIRKNLLAAGQTANELNHEYLEMKYANIIKVQQHPHTDVSYVKNPLKVGIMALLLGLVSSACIVLVLEYVSGIRRRRYE